MRKITSATLALLVAGGAVASAGACDATPPKPLTSIAADASPIGQWRYTTAQTVSTLLTGQQPGATMLAPTTAPSVLTEISAGLALAAGGQAETSGPGATGADGAAGARDAGVTADVLAAFDPGTQMFRIDGKPSAQLTWLAVRWLGPARHGAYDPERVSAGLRRRAAAAGKRLSKADTARSYLLALRSLDLLHAAPPAPAARAAVCAGLGRAYRARDVAQVATWVELSVRSSVSCADTTSHADLSRLLDQAAHAGRDNNQAFALAVREASVISAQRYLGLPTAEPAICPAVFASKAEPFLPDLNPATYLACTDEYAILGRTVSLSDASASRLRRDVVWRGRLPAVLQSNSFAVMMLLATLRSLGFGDAVVDAVAAQKPIDDPSSSPRLDAALIAIARGRGTFQISDADQDSIATAKVSDQLWHDATLAIVALQAPSCTAATTARLKASALAFGRSDDVRDLLYRAEIVRALTKCGAADAANAAGPAIRTALTKTGGQNTDIVQTWRVQEIRCLLGAKPDADPARVVALLPRPATDGWSGYSVFAGTRVTDILLHGCGKTWWGG